VEGLNLEWLVDHAAYARFGLLSALLLFPRGQFVRLVVAVFAGLELAYALASEADRTTIIWMSVLLGLALVILVAGFIAGRTARLSPEEQAMSAHLLKGVGRSRARHFIDQGYWLNGRAGEVLLREGEPVTRFCYLNQGEAKVLMDRREIGVARAGDVVGGLSFFSGETSAATVVLAGPARFWCAPAERLKPYFDAHPDLRRKVERNMHADAPEPPAPDELPVDAQGALPAT